MNRPLLDLYTLHIHSLTPPTVSWEEDLEHTRWRTHLNIEVRMRVSEVGLPPPNQIRPCPESGWNV